MVARRLVHGGKRVPEKLGRRLAALRSANGRAPGDLWSGSGCEGVGKAKRASKFVIGGGVRVGSKVKPTGPTTQTFDGQNEQSVSGQALAVRPRRRPSAFRARVYRGAHVGQRAEGGGGTF